MDGLREESFSETEQERQTEEQTGVSSVIYVYVCGAVQAPGVYALQDGMRVYEALAAAGGFREDADTQWLNQAAPVQDGQRLYVYTQEEVQTLAADASQTTGSDPGSGDAAHGRVDLNTASKELLPNECNCYRTTNQRRNVVNGTVHTLKLGRLCQQHGNQECEDQFQRNTDDNVL